MEHLLLRGSVEASNESGPGWDANITDNHAAMFVGFLQGKEVPVMAQHTITIRRGVPVDLGYEACGRVGSFTRCRPALFASCNTGLATLVRSFLKLLCCPLDGPMSRALDRTCIGIFIGSEN